MFAPKRRGVVGGTLSGPEAKITVLYGEKLVASTCNAHFSRRY